MLNIILTFIGIWLSTISMSLENRLRILPRGVVSKKDIGDLRMRINMELWRRVAARRVKTLRRTVATMMERDWRRPSTP